MMRVSGEGFRSIVTMLLLCLVMNILVICDISLTQVCVILAWVSLSCACVLFWFYRDPDRQSTESENVILSAADGKIIKVIKLDETEELNGPAWLISVFMSPLDVHVNRATSEGTIESLNYRPGKYLLAWHEKSSDLNEALTVTVRRDDGRRIVLRQIAGFLARRIVIYVREGARLRRGQRYGMIKLGSRLDHILPLDINITVSVGQRVYAGISPLGEFK